MKKTTLTKTIHGRLAVMGVILSILIVLGPAVSTEARITRVEFTHVESPAFEGESFGSVGTYDKLVGMAYGEVDPNNPKNAIIQDIGLAPRTENGMVEYSMDIYILRPSNMSRGNDVILYEMVNRGSKIAMFARFHQDAAFTNDPTAAQLGDARMMTEGYTLVWSGWQGDLVPAPGSMMMNVPTAFNPDGSSITGVVRSELSVMVETPSLPLGSGLIAAISGSTPRSYPTVSMDNETPLPDGFLPTLTVRTLEQDPREPIPNTQWDFGSCPDGETLTPGDVEVCLYDGFQPKKIYELVYMAKDPLVLGLGFAGVRDIVSFLKYEKEDDEGAPNPVAKRPGKAGPRYALLTGMSQTGRATRTWLHLGFNEDEAGCNVNVCGDWVRGNYMGHCRGENRIVFDGAIPHISAGHVALNIRFAQPGRGLGLQVEHLFPSGELPLSYTSTTDPYTGRTGGALDRCTLSNTCPKIFHIGTAVEIYEGRDSLTRTDPLGQYDLPEHPLVRTYINASTQHAPGRPPLYPCRQQTNPAPFKETDRALLDAMIQWVKKNRTPPPSQAPMISDGTLVAPEDVNFPYIPANEYGGVSRLEVIYPAQFNPLTALDRGPFYNGRDMSGVISIQPPTPIPGADYKVLAPQVDEDGIDLAGVHSTTVLAPIGTHSGWNMSSGGWFEGQLCALQGSYIPFADTRAERLAVGDPRLSLEERYGDHDGYVAAVQAAADHLVSERFLLQIDADRLIAQAEASDVLLP